jgi:hypothetical protein
MRALAKGPEPTENLSEVSDLDLVLKALASREADPATLAAFVRVHEQVQELSRRFLVLSRTRKDTEEVKKEAVELLTTLASPVFGFRVGDAPIHLASSYKDLASAVRELSDRVGF